MDLFNTAPSANLLPYDGTVIYFGTVLSKQQADHYLDVLLRTVAWKNDEAVIFGKHLVTARKVAWYADKEFSYRYSGTTKTALIWTPELLELKKIAESLSGHPYNSCLLNLYHSGDEGMSWHSDDEKSLDKNSGIGSLSLGAERKFAFKHKGTKAVVSVLLEHGGFLVMQGATQSNWLHRLPTSTVIRRPRINLTFRTMVEL